MFSHARCILAAGKYVHVHAPLDIVRPSHVCAFMTVRSGVSVDTVESHKKSERKNRLNFPLVSDHDK